MTPADVRAIVAPNPLPASGVTCPCAADPFATPLDRAALRAGAVARALLVRIVVLRAEGRAA